MRHFIAKFEVHEVGTELEGQGAHGLTETISGKGWKWALQGFSPKMSSSLIFVVDLLGHWHRNAASRVVSSA